MKFSLPNRIERCGGGTASPEGLGSNGGEAVQIAFGMSWAILGANAVAAREFLSRPARDGRFTL